MAVAICKDQVCYPSLEQKHIRLLTIDRASLFQSQHSIDLASKLQHVQIFGFGEKSLSILITLSLLFILRLPLLSRLLRFSSKPRFSRLQTAINHPSRLQLVQFFCFGKQRLSAFITLTLQLLLRLTLLLRLRFFLKLRFLEIFHDRLPASWRMVPELPR